MKFANRVFVLANLHHDDEISATRQRLADDIDSGEIALKIAWNGDATARNQFVLDQAINGSMDF